MQEELEIKNTTPQEISVEGQMERLQLQAFYADMNRLTNNRPFQGDIEAHFAKMSSGKSKIMSLINRGIKIQQNKQEENV